MKTIFIFLVLLSLAVYGVSRGWQNDVAKVANKAQPIAEKVVDKVETKATNVGKALVK
jgi:Na+-transporting methylmalonyl-CoA/oxaloacetate decarboxylase gamma subunit